MHYSPRIWPKTKGPSRLVFSSLSPPPLRPLRLLPAAQPAQPSLTEAALDMGGYDSRNPSTETLLFSTAAKNSSKIVQMRVCLARCASLLSIGWTLPNPTFKLFGWKIVRSWRASSSRLNVRHPMSALNVLPVRLLQCLQYMRLHW